MTDLPTATSINTSSSTSTSPARVVPTASQPVRVSWGDWIEQLLVHETPAIEAAAQAGLDVGAAAIPGGIGTIAVNMFGPTIVKEVVGGVVKAVGGAVAGDGTTIAPGNTIETMAANVLNSTVPNFVSKAEGLLDGWISSAVSAIAPKS